MQITIDFIGNSVAKKEVLRRILEVLNTENIGYLFEVIHENGDIYKAKKRLLTRISDLDEQC